MMDCPFCESDKTVKKGQVVRQNKACQRYKCNVCEREFYKVLEDIVEEITVNKIEIKHPMEDPERIRKDVQIIHLQQELKELKKLYGSAIKRRSLSEDLLIKMGESINALPVIDLLPPLLRPTTGKPEEAVLLLSDLHMDETVSRDVTGGITDYDFKTFVARLEYLSDELLDIIKVHLATYKINTLNVFLLGDMFSGMIHDELMITNSMNIVDSLVSGSYVLSQFLMEMCARFEKVNVVGVVGNHGRMQRKKHHKESYVNWDWLCYHMMSLHCENQPNITFKIPKSFWTNEEIMGHKFLLLHGDNVRSWMGIPWYGIERMVMRLTELLAGQDVTIDNYCMAHFHNQGTLDRVRGEVIMNGSFIGGSEFSIGTLFRSAKPKQWLFGVHPDHPITWRFGLDLSPAEKGVRYVW